MTETGLEPESMLLAGTMKPMEGGKTGDRRPETEGWVTRGAIDTAKNVAEEFRKAAVYGYGGLSSTEYALLKPVADGWDFYAEKAGLKDPEKQSATRRRVAAE